MYHLGKKKYFKKIKQTLKNIKEKKKKKNPTFKKGKKIGVSYTHTQLCMNYNSTIRLLFKN